MFRIKYRIRDVIDDWIIAIRKNIGDDRFPAELSRRRYRRRNSVSTTAP